MHPHEIAKRRMKRGHLPEVGDAQVAVRAQKLAAEIAAEGQRDTALKSKGRGRQILDRPGAELQAGSAVNQQEGPRQGQKFERVFSGDKEYHAYGDGTKVAIQPKDIQQRALRALAEVQARIKGRGQQAPQAPQIDPAHLGQPKVPAIDPTRLGRLKRRGGRM